MTSFTSRGHIEAGVFKVDRVEIVTGQGVLLGLVATAVVLKLKP